MSDPRIVEDPERRRYDLVVDGEVAGHIAFRDHDGARDMLHTEVDPARGGQGLGTVLVRGALDDARARGLRVIPTCPFVARYLARHPA